MEEQTSENWRFLETNRENSKKMFDVSSLFIDIYTLNKAYTDILNLFHKIPKVATRVRETVFSIFTKRQRRAG